MLASSFFGLQRCATPTPPRGGDIDSIGPVLVLEESTPNFQTNFRPDRIELTFDEWVELDFQQEIVISPPLDLGADNRPQLRRRSLVIPLEGVELRDSVTYVVNIGSAIKDLNEGNPTENLRFVFATGPILDTASVTGSVVDEFTGEPLEAIAVSLYDNLADTAVFTENPTYFAISEEDGTFTIGNVRPGEYRVVALQRNPGATAYYPDYDGVFPPLAVGFRDSTILVSDAENPIGEVRVSPIPVTPLATEVTADEFGLIKIGVNQPAGKVDLRSGREYLRNDLADTIRLYYREPAADTILLGRDSIYSDTVFVSGAMDDAPVLPLTAVGKSTGKVNPGEGIRLVFNRPLSSIDTSLVRLFRDTFVNPVAYTYTIDSVYPAELRLRANWSEAAPYFIELLPTAVTDWYGTSNPDTIARSLNVAAAEEFGVLTVTLANLNSTLDYILRLVDSEGEVIVGTRRFIHERFEYIATYRSLPPGNYLVELIYDSNGNERFDSGDLRFGRQPEVVQRFETEELRANWEVEKSIDLENNQ
ncbi:carboxypeptidase family protein [Neolewinella xylanilytica]|uniref:Carboxypeptidase family protein n=2 Tax=Neolewinella xylanilytica TaxID=1514080 RepID=A0A2S6I3V1_9BACT|nr:carboxypeptidase family protein [Neolewinella xylanilytica]